MADTYCSACGNSMPAGAQFCGRCGASAGYAAPDSDATRTDVYSPYQPTEPGAYGFAAPPVYPTAPSPPPRRRASPALMLAIAALAVAVIAVAVVVIVVSTGNGSAPAAAGQTSSATSSTVTSPTSSAASTAPTGSPTLTQPQIVTVTRSATLTAPAAGVAAEPVPLSTDQLRSVFESGTRVDPNRYGGNDTVFFVSPSHNIECAIFADDGSVQCAINRYDFPQPGPDCDNGALFTLDSGGSATYSGCLQSRFIASGTTLAYQGSITIGEFGCVSRSVGISCVNLDTDTGFSLSREEFIPVN